MSKFKIKPVGKGKVNISKQVSCRLYGVSWRLGTSQTVINDENEIEAAKVYINQYIEKRKGWSLSQLVDAHPNQYRRALNRKTGSKAVVTYRTAVADMPDYLRSHVSSNTVYNRIRTLERFGKLYDLNGIDVTLLTAEEVNRLLLKYHESLNTKSPASFDSSLSAFRWLYRYLKAKGYTDRDYLEDYKVERPTILKTTADSDERTYYDDHELEFIYTCLDDNRHLNTDPVYFKDLRRDIRAGKVKDDYQYYMAHFKVRRVLQLMIDTGMRSGEVITLRKSALNGVVQLNRPIDFQSKLWRELEVHYENLIDEEPFMSILESVKVEDITIENISSLYPKYKRLSVNERMRLLNTMRFIKRFDDPDLTYWADFEWRNLLNGDRQISKRNPRSMNISNILTMDKDIFWLADAIPGYDSSLIVISTVTKDVDDKGKVYLRAKDGAKTKAGSRRLVPLNKRARDTIVKLWRDILTLEQPVPDKIDQLFLNQEGKLYEPSAITNSWTKLLKKMLKQRPDLPKLTPHGLRHSYITKRAREAVTIGDLMNLRDNVGHGNFSTTTDVYGGRSKGHVDISKSDI